MAKWKKIPTDSDVAPFSDDPVIRRHLRRHRVKWLILLALVLVGIGFSVKPAYRWFRNEQINRNLEEAFAAQRVQDWGLARDKARSVLLARRDDFDAYRIWFRALAELNDPTTYLVAMGLFVNPKATTTDKVESLHVLSRQAPHSLAIAAFQSLEPEVKQQTATRIAFAPLLIERQQLDMAEKMMREAPEIESDPAAKLEYLRLLCIRPTQDRVEEARGILTNLIEQGAGKQALEALLVLSETPKGLAPGKPLPALPEWVASQPEAQTLHHLVALLPDLEAAGDQSEPIIRKAIDRFLDLDPGIVGTWLVRVGQSEKAAQILETHAQTSPTAYIARLNALLRLGRIEEIPALYESAPPSVDLVEFEIVKAAVARARKDAPTEKAAWTAAMNNAAFDRSSNRFFEIVRATSTLGATRAMEDAWVAAIRVGWGRIPLSIDLLPLMQSLEQQNRDEDLLAVYRSLARFEPNNTEILYNLNYLSLIMEVNPPANAIPIFEDLVRKNPEAHDLRCGLAVAHLAAGQAQKAMEQVPFLDRSRLIGPDLRALIQSTAWIMSGDKEKGLELANTVNWSKLLRREVTLFRKILASIEVVDELPQLPVAAAEVPEIDPESNPAWRNAVRKIEEIRSQEILPPLPTPKIPGSDLNPEPEEEAETLESGANPTENR